MPTREVESATDESFDPGAEPRRDVRRRPGRGRRHLRLGLRFHASRIFATPTARRGSSASGTSVASAICWRPAPYNQGRLLTRAAINAALAQPDPCAALGYHPASGDPTDSGSHGTHVADILAGNRREPGSEVGLAAGGGPRVRPPGRTEPRASSATWATRWACSRASTSSAGRPPGGPACCT